MRDKAIKEMLPWATILLAVLTAAFLPSCQAESAEVGLYEGIESVERVEEAVWEWSPDTDCSPCHATEAETAASSLCAISQDEGNPCLFCHSDTATLSQVHTVPFETHETAKLRNTEVGSSSCAQCHNAEELVAANAGRTMLVDSNGKSVDPHVLPDTENHAALACSNCHKPHNDIPAAETALATCLSCHHQDVFECYTCHS